MPEKIKQSLDDLDVTKLTPLSAEVINRQATINIGTIGHVAHGKSTVVKALTGVLPTRFKREKERNITIKLGYANAKIYKCDNEQCPRPSCYTSAGSKEKDEFPCRRRNCGGKYKLLRHVSFVDCPGHEILMETMLNGVAVMDAGLLLIAANEQCPQPQTSEHLAAIEIMKLKNITILQNKIDLVSKQEALNQHCRIKEFIEGTTAEKSPILPISAELNFNIDVLCEYLATKVPVPIRDFTSEPKLIIVRSFDVNKPGCEVENLQGGIAGGSLIKGCLRVGQPIEIRPGIVTKDSDGKLTCRPIFSKVVSLYAEQNELQYAVPGGLIGVGTNIDPELCIADRLVGQMLGAVDSLPRIFSSIDLTVHTMKQLLGVKANGDEEPIKIKKLKEDEVVLLNIGSTSTGATIKAVKKEYVSLALNLPVCTELGEKVAVSRKIDMHWRLIGWGKIVKGSEIIPILA